MKINEWYLSEKGREEISSFFESEGFLQLGNFLGDDLSELILKIKELPFKEVYNPLLIKRKEFTLKGDLPFEVLKFLEFFRSRDFIKFVEEISEMELVLSDLRLCTYSHGDFQIIRDDDKARDCLELIFDITLDEFKEDMGGILTYTSREEEILYVFPTYNSLSLIFRPAEIFRYMKYINCNAEKREILRVEMKFDLITT